MHASWTVASLREILEKIPGIVTTVDQALVRRDLVNLRLTRPQRTALQLLSRRCFDHADHISSLSSSQSRVFHLQFLHSLRDFQLLPDAVRMRLNVPTSNSDAPSCVPSEFGAVFLSLGYEPSKGSGYRVGWANATASGVIGNNKWDAETVVAAIREQDILKDKRPGIAEWLKSSSCQRVTWEGWCRIDEEEKRRAALAGRQAQRIKIQSVSEMLRIASGQQALSSESPKSILNPQQMAPPSTIQH